MPELENKLAAPEGCAPLTCSALDAALALVDFGPCRGAERPQDWIHVAGPMCTHCEGMEDVNLAAARIIAAEYRNVLKILKDPVAVHINMLRGTIAWTPGHLRHVLGDSSTNATEQQPEP